MQSQLLKQPPILTLVIVVCSVGLLMGIASVWVPPALILIGIAGIVYVTVAWFWPEIALLGILFFTSTIFDIYAYPSIPIGVGNLIISDLLIFVLLAIILLRGFIKSSSYFIHTPLDFPLLGFYFTALIATGLGIFNSRISFNQSLGEVRDVNFYLTFFIVTNLVRNEKQLRRLYKGLIFLAVFVALAMIAQYVLGNAIQLLPGRVETLSTAGTVSYGITRVLPPGQSLVLIVFVCSIAQILFDKESSRFMINLIQLGVVGLAVLLTFNRSFWMAIILASLLVGLLVSIREKVKFVNIVFWTTLVGGLLLTPLLTMNSYLGEKLFDSIMVRMSTMFNPNTAQEESLSYRYIENEYAYAQIGSHPLFGLGLGASYRPFDRRIRSSGTYYIHNGHFWVMLKTGLIGYLFFMWTLLLFIKRSIQNWKYIPDPSQKGLVLSFGVMVFGMLFVSIVNPIFRDWFWAPITGVMLGMGEAVIGMNRDRIGYSAFIKESKPKMTYLAGDE